MSCCRARGGDCERCVVLVGLDGLRVIGVDRDFGRLVVKVESDARPMGCTSLAIGDRQPVATRWIQLRVVR
jgi:hypothetical protein